MIKIIFYILSAILLFSCGDPPLTAEELEEIADADDPRARIKMDMDGDLNLTLSVKNFPSLNYLSFKVIFNYNILSVSTINNGKFNMDYSSYEVSQIENNSLSFQFSNVSGEGELLKIKYSGNNFEGTTIYIEGMPLLIDSNDEEVIIDSDSFYSEQVCYINQHPTNGDVYGDHQWLNSFCFPIQNDWRE